MFRCIHGKDVYVQVQDWMKTAPYNSTQTSTRGEVSERPRVPMFAHESAFALIVSKEAKKGRALLKKAVMQCFQTTRTLRCDSGHQPAKSWEV
jgi:hypothetical protein